MGWSPSGDTSTYKKCTVNKISEKEGKMNISIICIVQYVFTSTCCFVLGHISWWHPNKRLPKLHRQEVDSLLLSNRAGGKCNNLEWRGRCVRFVYTIWRKNLQTRRLELKNVKNLNKKLKWKWIQVLHYYYYFFYYCIINYYLMSAISYSVLHRAVARSRERNGGNMHEKGK